MDNRYTHQCIKTIKMMLVGLILFIVPIWALGKGNAAAPDSSDIFNLSFSQLSKLRITSASKVSQRISEVPATVVVVTSTEIRDRGYFTLEEVLADLPGFQFRGIPGFNTYFFQRGFPNQNNLTLVLVDGVQINELNSGGAYAGGQYNLSNIERIEIVYGPSSVVYGTNAVSGIINIVTKSSQSNSIEINATAGNFNSFKSDFIYSYINDNKTFAIHASGMVKKSDKSDLAGSEGDNNWTDLIDNYENDYAFDLKLEASDFTFGTNYQYKQASTAVWNKSVGTVFRDYGTSWNIQFVNNYLKYKKKFSENFTLSSTLYNRNATVLSNTVYYVLDTAQVGYFRPNNLTGIEGVANYSPTDFLSVTGGLTFEIEQLSKSASLSLSSSPSEKPPTPETPEMLHNNLLSIFAEPRADLWGVALVSAGVRFDHSSVYDDVFTPSFGLVVPFLTHRFRASYSESFRAPKPWDYTDGIGNGGLKPEKGDSYEAGLSFSFWDRLRLDVSGYISHIDDAIVKELLGDSFRWNNGGQMHTNGAIVQCSFAAGDWVVGANYTYSESFDVNSIAIPEISKHIFNSSLTYSFNKYMKLNLRGNYVGKRENPKLIAATGSKFVDPYFVLNGAFSIIDYNGINLQLAVKNLFDVEYYHTSNRPPDRYRQAQRTFYLTIGLNLAGRKQG